MDKYYKNISKEGIIEVELKTNSLEDARSFMKERLKYIPNIKNEVIFIVTDINKITKSISDFKEKYKIKGDMFEVLI